MKLYLAHPINLRNYIRETEWNVEKETGVELYNPFYDAPGRDDIDAIDAGTITRWEVKDHNTLVIKDLLGILRCDGLVAYVTKSQFMVGTICEMWFAQSVGKPVYIITPDAGRHPWLRFIAEQSKGKIFSSWGDFAEWVKTRNSI